MNEKEMVKHIKDLTRIIHNQTEYSETLARNFTSITRRIDNLVARVLRLEGIKLRDDE